jgi:hypothetical protein
MMTQAGNKKYSLFTSGKLRLLAYLLIILVAGYSAVRAEQAVHLARTVDHNGDIRTCEATNNNRRAVNEHNAALEATAKLNVRALRIIANTSPAQSEKTLRLRALAVEARKIQVNFPTIKPIDCHKQFPAP